MSPLKLLYYGLLGACLVAPLVRYKRLERRHLFFIPLLLLAILTQVIAEAVAGKGIGHYFLFHLYIPAEYLLLSLYYAHLFAGKTARRLLAASALLLVIFCAGYYFRGPLFWQPDYTDFVTGSLLVTACVITFFTGLFRGEAEGALLRLPDFWINAGHLFFYAGCVFVMGLHFSLRQQNPPLANGLLQINHYLNLLLYLFYLIAFTWAQPKRIFSPSSLPAPR